MRRAIQTVTEMGGGIATADGWQFPLPITGMMSPEPFAATVRRNRSQDRKDCRTAMRLLTGRATYLSAWYASSNNSIT